MLVELIVIRLLTQFFDQPTGLSVDVHKTVADRILQYTLVNNVLANPNTHQLPIVQIAKHPLPGIGVLLLVRAYHCAPIFGLGHHLQLLFFLYSLCANELFGDIVRLGSLRYPPMAAHHSQSDHPAYEGRNDNGLSGSDAEAVKPKDRGPSSHPILSNEFGTCVFSLKLVMQVICT